MKRLLIPAMLVLFLGSCEKEKETVYEDYQSNTLLRQIKTAESDMEVFTYYNTGGIFEHVQLFSYRKFLYDEQNRLTKIEIAQSLNPLSCAIIPGTDFEAGDDPRKAKVGQITEFDYTEAGTFDTKRYYYMDNDNKVLMNYEEYEYENNKVVKISLYNPQDQLTYYRTYLYNNNGNVSEEKFYYMEDGGTASLQSKTLYLYDDKNNPFKVFAVEGTPGRNTNENNITRQITISYYSGEESSYTVDYTYEYNELGYPVKVNGLEYIYGEEG